MFDKILSASTLSCEPSCGVEVDDEADRLSTVCGTQEQWEAEAILRNNLWAEQRQRLHTGTDEDSIHPLDRAVQLFFFFFGVRRLHDQDRSGDK